MGTAGTLPSFARQPIRWPVVDDGRSPWIRFLVPPDLLLCFNRPLSIVAPELRAAYRLLKNAGYVPPAVQLRREIADAEMLLSEARGVEARGAASKRLRYLLTRLAAADLRLQQDYYDKLVERLGPGGVHPQD
ncbi:MAG: DUF1992 domain-containing protein [Gammaproteobacteria bacterium]